MAIQLNVLTTNVFPDKSICKDCKHYREAVVYGTKTQVIDKFCINCYSDKVYIVTRFEKKEGRKQDGNENETE